MIRKLFIFIVVVWRMFTQYLKLKWESIVDKTKNDPEETVFCLTIILLIVGMILGATAVLNDFEKLGISLIIILPLLPLTTVLIICLIKKIKKLIKSIKQEIKKGN